MSHPIPDEALDADIAILGKKGRGKTYAAKGIVERLLEMERRVVILDPLSTWWGLRTSADGKGAGYPVAVFGGPHGDMPLNDKMGTALAQTLAATNLPSVIDLGEMTKAATVRFARDFLAELFRKNRDPLWLILEEADLLAPQNPMGDTAAVLAEVDRIARRGRAFGFRLITMTQRPARLHKDVLTQLSTLIAMGVSSPQDRDAIKAWVEGNADRDEAKEVTKTLASLKVGEGWVWAPDHDILKRVKFPPIKTLDTSRTPKVGEKRIEQVKLAEVDLSAIQDALATEPEEKQSKTKAPSEKALKDAESAGFDLGLIAGQKRGYQRGYAVALSAAQQAVNGLRVGHSPDERTQTVKSASPSQIEITIAEATCEKLPNRDVRTDEKTDLKISVGAERKPLAILCSSYPAGYTDAQWAALSGYKRTGGTWGTYKSRLRSKRLIEQRGALWFATQGGVEALGDDVSALPTTPKDRLAMWKSKIPGVGPMLDTLFVWYPSELKRAKLAQELGMTETGGTFGTYLSRLRSNGLIEEPQRGVYRLTSIIME